MQILNSARDVCLSLHGLVSQARTANGNDMDHPSYNQVADYSKGVIMNISNFIKFVKMFEEESSRGTRAVQSSIEAIAQEIHNFSSMHEPRLEEAKPEYVIRAIHAITQSAHKIVEASSSRRQEDLLAAANIGRCAVTELLTTCKGVACEDQLLHAAADAGAVRDPGGAVPGPAGQHRAGPGQEPQRGGLPGDRAERTAAGCSGGEL